MCTRYTNEERERERVEGKKEQSEGGKGKRKGTRALLNEGGLSFVPHARFYHVERYFKRYDTG